MKWVLWTLVGLVAVAGLVAFVGWMLPVGHVASRSARFNQPPEAVYGAITDVRKYGDWWSEVKGVDMLEPANGKIRFREHMSTGPIVFEVDEAVPATRYVTRIADPGQPFGGTWTFELAPEAGGTRLTITERGEVYNPIFRFMSHFVFSQTATMESFLAGLGRKFERQG
jgi:ribosome-associated toxin RatA of RatAB toxin-antitoxin module